MSATTSLAAQERATAAAYGLSAEDLDALGAELDELRRSVVDDLGSDDVDYIRRVIRAQRALEVAGRGLLFVGFLPPAWLAGTAALAVSKILDNMEIGHNVMHGQYDWTRDPALSSSTFEWDNACPGDEWRHSHNYMHHTHTNVVGRDRDVHLPCAWLRARVRDRVQGRSLEVRHARARHRAVLHELPAAHAVVEAHPG